MANNYKVKMIDLQNKYKFKIFCSSQMYDDSELKQKLDTIYKAFPKASATGTDASLDGTAAAPMTIDLKGNTSQNGTPTPSSPIPINVVSGDNYIDICGKNLFDKNNIEIGKFYVSNGTSTSTNWAISQVPVKPNTSYYLSGNNYNNAGAKIVLLDSSMNILQDLGGYNVVHSITTTSATAYIGLSIAIYSGASDLDSIQLEVGSSATTYEPYIGHSYPITLPSGMFLGGIGNYVDFLFKAINGNEYYDSLSQAQKNLLTYGSWYLHKEIGKVVYDGSVDENWYKSSTTSIDRFYIQLEVGVFDSYSRLLAYSDYFAYNTQLNVKLNYMLMGSYENNTRIFFDFSTYGTNTLAQFKTWLGSNNVTLYYVLATPTNTLIEDTTLIEQLEALRNAESYEGTTNISQANSDMPFIFTASAIKDLSNL